MMRWIYLLSTSVFIAAMVWFWSGSRTAAPVPKVAPRFTLAQVAQHAQASDCWMVIHGKVYDVTAYINSHPAPPVVLVAWCGKQASHAFDTKNAGRPHSPYARQLLRRYLLGDVTE